MEIHSHSLSLPLPFTPPGSYMAGIPAIRALPQAQLILPSPPGTENQKRTAPPEWAIALKKGPIWFSLGERKSQFEPADLVAPPSPQLKSHNECFPEHLLCAQPLPGTKGQEDNSQAGETSPTSSWCWLPCSGLRPNIRRRTVHAWCCLEPLDYRLAWVRCCPVTFQYKMELNYGI